MENFQLSQIPLIMQLSMYISYGAYCIITLVR